MATPTIEYTRRKLYAEQIALDRASDATNYTDPLTGTQMTLNALEADDIKLSLGTETATGYSSLDNAVFALKNGLDSLATHTHSNLLGGTGIFYRQTGTDAQFYSLIAGENISITGGIDGTNIRIGVTGFSIGTDVQAYDASLTSLAALATTADKMVYTTAVDTYAETPISAFGRGLVNETDAASLRTTLGLAVGVDVHPYDAALTNLTGLSSVDGNFIVGSPDGWITESGAEARISLGLGHINNVEFNQVTVGNMVIDDNSISSAGGNLAINPAAGGAIVLDGTVHIDAGIVTGLTDLTAANVTAGKIGIGTNTPDMFIHVDAGTTEYSVGTYCDLIKWECDAKQGFSKFDSSFTLRLVDGWQGFNTVGTSSLELDVTNTIGFNATDGCYIFVGKDQEDANSSCIRNNRIGLGVDSSSLNSLSAFFQTYTGDAALTKSQNVYEITGITGYSGNPSFTAKLSIGEGNNSFTNDPGHSFAGGSIDFDIEIPHGRSNFIPKAYRFLGPESGKNVIIHNGNLGIRLGDADYPVSPIECNGLIHSKSGGFKFPDGTTQATATFWSQNGSDIYYNTGNIGIGTGSPSQKLSVAGVIEATTGGFKFPDGSTQITAYTGGGGGGGSYWTLNGSDIYYNAGKIGIGVFAPDTWIHVDNGNTELTAGTDLDLLKYEWYGKAGLTPISDAQFTITVTDGYAGLTTSGGAGVDFRLSGAAGLTPIDGVYRFRGRGGDSAYSTVIRNNRIGLGVTTDDLSDTDSNGYLSIDTGTTPLTEPKDIIQITSIGQAGISQKKATAKISIGEAKVGLTPIYGASIDFEVTTEPYGLTKPGGIYRFKPTDNGQQITFYDGKIGIGTDAPDTWIHVDNGTTALSASEDIFKITGVTSFSGNPAFTAKLSIGEGNPISTNDPGYFFAGGSIDFDIEVLSGRSVLGKAYRFFGAYSGENVIIHNGNLGIRLGDADYPLSPIECNGLIHSTSGGFKFPDNTIMTSASTGYWTQNGSDIYYNAGKIGVGVSVPDTWIHVDNGTTELTAGTDLDLLKYEWYGQAGLAPISDAQFTITATDGYAGLATAGGGGVDFRLSGTAGLATIDGVYRFRGRDGDSAYSTVIRNNRIGLGVTTDDLSDTNSNGYLSIDTGTTALSASEDIFKITGITGYSGNPPFTAKLSIGEGSNSHINDPGYSFAGGSIDFDIEIPDGRGVVIKAYRFLGAYSGENVIIHNGNLGIRLGDAYYPVSPIECNGIIHSTSGGFKFPDGTTQATASTAGLWFQNGSNIYFNTGNIGIGTTAPASPLEVTGLIHSTSGGFKFPDGTTQATATFWSQNGSDIYFNTGNIGIGTTAPASPLEVTGLIHSTSGGFKFPDGTTQTTAASSNIQYDHIYNRLSFYTNASERMTIDVHGKVGIGRNNPTTNLELYRTGAGLLSFSLCNGTVNNFIGLSLYTGGSEGPNLYWRYGDHILIGHNTAQNGHDATFTKRMQINNSGVVQFHNYGAGTLQTDEWGTITASSDLSMKNIVGDFTKGLDAICALKPIDYFWKDGVGLDTTNQYTGFVANDVVEYIPEAVFGQEGEYTLSDRPIIAALVNAVKELSAELKLLKAA